MAFAETREARMRLKSRAVEVGGREGLKGDRKKKKLGGHVTADIAV